jgi:tRNA pseudouridine38-40 synthase
MNIAAKSLLGEHDFRSFQAAQCQSKTAKRRIYQLQVHQDGHLIVIDIIANAFLYHMVRNITGVLLAIGQQQQPLDWAKTVLLAQDRKQAGITAPASGLYLIDVKYPSHYGLPRPTVLPWFFRSEWQVEPYHIPEPSTNTLSI